MVGEREGERERDGNSQKLSLLLFQFLPIILEFLPIMLIIIM